MFLCLTCQTRLIDCGYITGKLKTLRTLDLLDSVESGFVDKFFRSRFIWNETEIFFSSIENVMGGREYNEWHKLPDVLHTLSEWVRVSEWVSGSIYQLFHTQSANKTKHAVTGRPIIHGRVVLILCKRWLVQCTCVLSRSLEKSLFTRYQKNTAMFIWSGIRLTLEYKNKALDPGPFKHLDQNMP